MLQKIQYFANYAKAIVGYASKVIDLLTTTINAWPQWISPTQEETNDEKPV